MINYQRFIVCPQFDGDGFSVYDPTGFLNIGELSPRSDGSWRFFPESSEYGFSSEEINNIHNELVSLSSFGRSQLSEAPDAEKEARDGND